MPYCPKCGNHYYVGTHSCSACGQLLVEQPNRTGGETKKSKRDKLCPYCNATGRVDGRMGGPSTIPCPVCNGRRYNFISEDWLKCSECGGTGQFTFGAGIAYTRKPCPDCKGTGWAESSA
jgi:hypothetical protein